MVIAEINLRKNLPVKVDFNTIKIFSIGVELFSPISFIQTCYQ